MPDGRKRELLKGYKVFFRGIMPEPGTGHTLRSAFIPGYFRCWHPDCNAYDPERTYWCEHRGRGKGHLWEQYTFGKGVYTDCSWPDKAPFSLFHHPEHAVAMMRKWPHMRFELWEVEYTEAAAPDMVEGFDLEDGTIWARSIRPKRLIRATRSVVAEEEKTE